MALSSFFTLFYWLKKAGIETFPKFRAYFSLQTVRFIKFGLFCLPPLLLSATLLSG
jgi:hypothetical protein